MSNEKRITRRIIPHQVTVLIALAVLASTIALNLVGADPVSYRTKNSYPETEIIVTQYGWPLIAGRRFRVYQDGKRIPLGQVDASIWVEGDSFYYVNNDAVNLIITGILLNLLVACILVASVITTVQYWIRHSRGPFRFSMPTLFILTGICCLTLALTQPKRVDWTYLCYPPIAFGCVCTVTTAAILFYSFLGRYERKQRRPRYRFRRVNDTEDSK